MLIPHREDEQRSGNAERHDPDQRDLHDGVLLLLSVSVAQRVSQRQVPVHGDHAQVTDGRRREQNVQAVPADTDQLWHRHICTSIQQKNRNYVYFTR